MRFIQQAILRGGLAALLFFLGATLGAQALAAATVASVKTEIHGCKFKTCTGGLCVAIDSPAAYTSMFLPGYSFAGGTVQIFKGSLKTRIASYTAGDIFFDETDKKIYLRDVSSRQNTDVLADLATGEIVEFKKR